MIQKRRGPVMLVLLLALLSVVIMTAGCFGPTKVSVTTVTERDMPLHIKNDANVTALNKATLEPAVSGQVSTYAVKVGDDVKQGQVVAMLDTSALQAQLTQLLGELQAQQSQAQVQAVPEQTTVVPGAVSQADVERAREMLQSGVITEKEFQTIEARSHATTVTTGGGYVATGGANTAGIQTAIAQIQAQIAQAQIVAPITGKVTAIYNEDRKVAVAGRPFMLIQQSTPLVGSLSIPQAFAAKLNDPAVRRDAKVYLKVDDKEIPGEITYVDPNTNGASPSVLVKATFNNTDGSLKPGEFYTLVIESNTTAPVLVLPDNVIHENKDGKFVYVVTADNTVDVRVVEVGESVDGYTAIISGLNKGEQVITTAGVYSLGEKVAIKS